MRNLICVKCHKTLDNERNGAVALECMDAGLTRPYKLWNCDIKKCSVCDIEVISGFAERPFAEHYDVTFDAQLAECEAAGSIIRFY